MLCFKDITFCSASDCTNPVCKINWRLRDNTDYENWSQQFFKGEGPIAFVDFSETCKMYRKK